MDDTPRLPSSVARRPHALIAIGQPPGRYPRQRAMPNRAYSIIAGACLCHFSFPVKLMTSPRIAAGEAIMAPERDWRSPAATDYFERLDIDQFAFEFVWRDPQFQRDRDELNRRVEAGRLRPAEAVRALRETWGLSFRRCRSEPARSLGTVPAAERHPGWSRTTWLRGRSCGVTRPPA